MQFKKIITSSPAFIIPAFINLASLVIFTRLLSLESYGKLSLALITIEFVQGLLFQWIKVTMMRFFTPEDLSPQIVGLQYNFAITILLLISVLLAYIINIFFVRLNINYILVVTLGIIARGLCYYIQDSIRISDTNLTRYTIVTLLSNGSFYIAAIVYVYIVKSPYVENILYMQLVGVGVFLFCYFLYQRKFILKNMFNIIKSNFYKEFVTYGLPLIVAFVATSMFIRIDRYIIECTVGLKGLGSYSAAFSLSNLAISSFFMILTLPTYPEIIRQMNEGNVASAKDIFKKNGNIIFLVGFPLVLIICFLNTFFCNLFFGAKGVEISVVFPFVVVGTFLYNFKLHYFDQIFQFAKKTNVIMILGIIVGVVHLGLSYKFAKVYGTKGVAFSGIILNAASILFIYYYSKSFFEISFNKKVCLATLLLCCVLFSCYLFYAHSIYR